MTILRWGIALLVSYEAQAFVLLNPAYQLHDAKTAKVKISSEGCTANGISNDKVKQAINSAIDFWNDVPESRLKLKYGGVSTASLSDSSVPQNEIIVGCGSLPSVNILGATNNDRTHGSARVTMNAAVYTGSYNEDSFIGTMTHEIGHGLGLYHSNDPASIMTYRQHGWVNRPTYISQDDIDGIVYLYPNEKNLEGFLGSCSSFASEETPKGLFLIETLMSFLTVIGISVMIRKVLRTNKSSSR